jgi:hypothetical protein
MTDADILWFAQCGPQPHKALKSLARKTAQLLLSTCYNSEEKPFVLKSFNDL